MVNNRTTIPREVFNRTVTNTAILTAGSTLVVEHRIAAEANNNLPHNSLVISNQDTSSVLFIFLDNASDVNTPDFVLFANQQITIPPEDGSTFTTLFIKNTHATNDIAANAIKIRIATVKEVLRRAEL